MIDDDDKLPLISLATMFAGSIAAAALVGWQRTVGFLTRYHVLATDDVVLALPGGGGPGLDLPRIVLGAGVLLVVDVLVRSRRKGSE